MAAFDFDGTLVAGDSLAPYLRALLGAPGAIRAATAVPAMVRAGDRSGAKAALLRRLLAGVDAAEAARVGERFGEALAGRVRPEMAGRLAWHRGEGHRLVLVSASLALYLEPFAAAAGLDDVVATRLEVGGDGRLTGELVGANVRGGEKVSALARLIGDPASVELWAYGDSAGDRQLLDTADHPTWVGGRRR